MLGELSNLTTIGGSVSGTILTGLQTTITETKTKLESNDPAQLVTINREAILGDMFYAGSLGYFAQYTALTHIAGLQQGAHQALLPSVGTYGYVPKVNYLFGLPRAIEPGGIEMDLDSISTFTGTNQTDRTQLINFVQQTGILSSALEHAVPEQMFTTDPQSPPKAISAVKALNIANAQGQRIYEITPANQATVLANIHHDNATMDEIRASLTVGKTIITHTDPVSVPGYSGAGYIILDPETGEEAYKISGGSNGSFTNVGNVLGAMLITALSVTLIALASGNSTFIKAALAALLLVMAAILIVWAAYWLIWCVEAQACFTDGLFAGIRAASAVTGAIMLRLPRLPKKIALYGIMANLAIGEFIANVLKPKGVACPP